MFKSGRTRFIKLAFGSLLGLGLAFSVSYPFTANSGFFAKITKIFGMTTYAVGEDTKDNSQTIGLLQASLSPNSSIGGADIKIVDGSALSPDLDELGPGDEPTSDQISIYVVRSGDTLSQIAKMFGVSVNTIIWANNIEGGLISPGDQLLILPVSGIRYKVVKGDTLASIAKKTGGDLAEIISFNNLSANSSLVAGTEIIVPDGEGTKHTSSTKTVSPKPIKALPSANGYFVRPVKGGSKSQGIHGYNGVDLAAPVGTPIYAAAAGRVIVAKGAGWNGGYGSYVVISHSNGTQTLYAHMSKMEVAVGETVEQGEEIGKIGLTGKTTGPHVHVEVRGAKNPF